MPFNQLGQMCAVTGSPCQSRGQQTGRIGSNIMLPCCETSSVCTRKSALTDVCVAGGCQMIESMREWDCNIDNLAIWPLTPPSPAAPPPPIPSVPPPWPIWPPSVPHPSPPPLSPPQPSPPTRAAALLDAMRQHEATQPRHDDKIRESSSVHSSLSLHHHRPVHSTKSALEAPTANTLAQATSPTWEPQISSNSSPAPDGSSMLAPYLPVALGAAVWVLGVLAFRWRRHVVRAHHGRPTCVTKSDKPQHARRGKFTAVPLCAEKLRYVDEIDAADWLEGPDDGDAALAISRSRH